MRSSTTLVALAALAVGDVLAGPTHAHLHRHAHDKKDLSAEDWSKIDWQKVGVNWQTVNYGNNQPTTTPAVPAVPAVAALSPSVAKVAQPSVAKVAQPSVAQASVTPSASASSASSSPVTPGGGLPSWLFQNLWHGLEGCSNKRTSFGQSTGSSGNEVSYIGNVGIPYGSVAMLVASADGYDHTITVVNEGSASKSMNLWLKAGSDGQANSGATSARRDTTLTFNLPVGKSQVIALAANVQGSIAESTDAQGDGGSFATAWLEFNTALGWPAWDCSWIQDPTKSYPMYATAQGTLCVSSKTQASWMTDKQQIGSGDCALNSNTAHITLHVGADPS